MMLPFFDRITFELNRLLLVNVLVFVFDLLIHLPSHMLFLLSLIFLKMKILCLRCFYLGVLYSYINGYFWFKRVFLFIFFFYFFHPFGIRLDDVYSFFFFYIWFFFYFFFLLKLIING